MSDEGSDLSKLKVVLRITEGGDLSELKVVI